MTAAVWIGLGLLGAVGAMARFAVSLALMARASSAFPVATSSVNTAGAFLAGVIAGLGLDGGPHMLLAGGLLGAFTTFSTWMVEAHRLGGTHGPRLMAAYVVGTTAMGLGFAALGWWLGAHLA